MMKAVITRSIGLATLGMTYAHTALAATGNIEDGANDARGSLSNTVSLGGFFGKITNILIYIIGAVAVIMLIIGGLRYVISQGNSQAVTQAKDTILYSVIGIVVAILAYAIVHFITTSLK